MTAHLISWQSLLDLGWLLFLLFAFGYFWHSRRKTMRSQLWIKTQGQIIRCEWTMQGHRVWPKVEFTYHIGDCDYIGEKIFLDEIHHDPNSKYARRLAYQVVNAYKKQEDVSIYYDPTDPRQAALDITIPRKLNLILGIIAFLLILHVTVVALRFFR